MAYGNWGAVVTRNEAAQRVNRWGVPVVSWGRARLPRWGEVTIGLVDGARCEVRQGDERWWVGVDELRPSKRTE